MEADFILKCKEKEKNLQELYDFNRNRIHDMYDNEFAVLEGFFDFTIELGQMMDSLIPQYKKPVLQFAMLRIHERALKVSREAKIMLENGSSSGAIARWRTLFEFSVVANILNQYPDLAGKYVEHVAIDDYKYSKKLIKYKDRLNLWNYNMDAFPEITKEYEAAKKKYGWTGKNDYEWARNADIPNPNLFELAKVVGLEHLYAYVDEAHKYNHPSMRYLLNDRGAHPSETASPLYTIMGDHGEPPVQSESKPENYLFSHFGMELPIQLVTICLHCINSTAITAYSKLETLEQQDVDKLALYSQCNNEFPETVIALITQRFNLKEDILNAH